MLEVSVPIAHELLAQCIRQGQALVQRASLVGDFSDYESWKAARNQWIEPTSQALDHMYGARTGAGEFAQALSAPGSGQRWQQQYAVDLNAVKAAIELLTVLQSDLAFTSDTAGALAGESEPTAGPTAESFGSDHRAELPQPQPQPEPLQQPQPQPLQQPALAEQPMVSEQPAQHAQPVARAPAHMAEQALHDADDPGDRQERDERADDRLPVGAELAPAPFVGAELAQHAKGSVSAERAGSPGPTPEPIKQVLLAHGPNERWMQAVARLLEQAGTHEVTILNERPNGRAALAEQFGEHAPGSRYAVVLLTADDIAAPRVDSEEEPYFSPRAHQAVVFEMGFLVAALAPGRVCVLYEEGVQLPCDLDGIAYVRLDLAGTWQPKLLLQLRKAGFDYDLNKLVAA
jgi:predicted nucleotide-binding protein